MLEVRFIEINRTAGREFGVQWNTYSNSGRFLGNVGNRTPADQLPITDGGSFMQPGANRVQMSPATYGGTSGPLTRSGPNVLPNALKISPIVAAGVLSGTAPFGFMIGRLIANGLSADALINALEQKGVARSLAEPNLVALSGDTASFLAGGEFPVPGAGSARPDHDRVEALRRPARLHPDRARRRADQHDGRARGERTRPAATWCRSPACRFRR